MLIKVCTGKKCSDRHSKYILARLEREKEAGGFGDKVMIEPCTCQGRCDQGPTMLFDRELLVGMNPVKASEQLMKRLGLFKKKFEEKKPQKESPEGGSEGYYSNY